MIKNCSTLSNYTDCCLFKCWCECWF